MRRLRRTSRSAGVPPARARLSGSKLVAAFVATTVTGGLLGSLAGTPPTPAAPRSNPIGSGDFHVVSTTSTCAPTAMSVGHYLATYSKTPSPGYYVNGATVGGIPATCNGDSVTVALINSLNQTIGTGTAPTGSTSVAVSIGPNGSLYPLAHDVVSVTVTISSNTVDGNVEVANGQTFSCSSGMTINGNVTVDAGGTFVGLSCTVTGNVVSAGKVTLTSSTVGGNLQPGGGGPVKISGSTVGGNLQVQGLTNAAQAMICASNVKGSLSWQSSSEPVQLGGSSGCPGNAIGKDFTVQSNTGVLTIGSGSADANGAAGPGNTTQGNISVQSNTVSSSSTLAGNWAGGNCTLQNDNPKVVVPSSTSNVARNSNKCQVSA